MMLKLFLILKFLKFFIGPKQCTYNCVFAAMMALLRFFIEIFSYRYKLITIAFFPWQGIHPTVGLHLKEGPHETLHKLNRTMLNIKKGMKKVNR